MRLDIDSRDVPVKKQIEEYAKNDRPLASAESSRTNFVTMCESLAALCISLREHWTISDLFESLLDDCKRGLATDDTVIRELRKENVTASEELAENNRVISEIREGKVIIGKDA